MKDNLLEIINYNGVIPQLKHFNSEVFELNEAIIKEEAKRNYMDTMFYKEHITEEIVDCLHMLFQFIVYYEIPNEDIEKGLLYKNKRTLTKVRNGEKI